MKRILSIFLLMLFLGALKASAQQPIIDYIYKLQNGDNRWVTSSTYHENRDQKTSKLKMRYIQLMVNDKSIIKELRKLIYNEREKATRIMLDDSQSHTTYMAVFDGNKNPQVTVIVEGTRTGWEISLREVYNSKDSSSIPEEPEAILEELLTMIDNL